MKLKISCCSGEGGVPAAQTPSNDRGIHPIKARRGLSSQSGHVSALIHISSFPQPLRQHVNRGRPSARCTIWQRVSFQIRYEELQSRNPHFSKNNRSCCHGCSLVRRRCLIKEAERYAYSRISTDQAQTWMSVTVRLTTDVTT